MDRALSEDIEKVLSKLPIVKPATGQPALVVISGLPGTGKSYVARILAERLPAVIVESDFIRKTLFGKPTYSGVESAWVHRIAHIILRKQLRSGRHAIYDATNISEWTRKIAYRIAEQTDARLIVVRTTAPEKVVRARLERRSLTPDVRDFSDADWDVFTKLKRSEEAIQRRHYVVNTAQDKEISRAVSRILRTARCRASAHPNH